MMQVLKAWQWIVSSQGQTLLEAAERCDRSQLRDIAALRRLGSLEEVSAALELVSARHKAHHKFGSLASRLLADRHGVEQASSLRVARYKAGRLAAMLAADRPVLDLCSGIGADAVALVETGRSVLAVDHAPLRAWMTRENTRWLAGQPAEVAVADVAHVRPEGRALHLDPTRRVDQGRLWRLEDYQPGPAVIRRLLHESPAACLKLSPGVDPDVLADVLDGEETHELEFVAEEGRLVQALAWWGAFRKAPRSATVIDQAGAAHRLSGAAGAEDAIPLGESGRYLYTVHAAVERAGLIGLLAESLKAVAPHPKLGLLSSDTWIESPFLTGFELLECLPWREAKVKRWIEAHGGGVVEVKTRGKAVNPDLVQPALRGRGDIPYTVFVLREDRRVRAWICRRPG